MLTFTRLVCLSVLLSVAALSADQVRPRFPAIPSGDRGAVKVTVTSPTLNPTWTSNSAGIEICGTAGGPRPIQSVTWVNSRGGSGTAVGTNSWCIPLSSASAAVVFQDNMNAEANTNLDAHTPTPTGTGWTKITAPGASTASVRAAEDWVRPTTTANSVTMLYTATPNPAIGSTDYDVQATVGSIASNADDPQGLVFGYANSTNYCAAVFYTTSSALYKVVAGTVTSLDTQAITLSVGQVYKVEVRGTGLSVTQNDVEILSATDSFCDNALGVGVIWGGPLVATDDQSSLSAWDDFGVIDQASSSTGIVLQTGAANVISITATDTMDVEGVDTLSVTYVASDATNPTLSIDFPTSSPTHSTATAGITLSGVAADNTAVTSVTWACAACTPNSGTATGTTSWSFATTLTCSGGGALNTITVTAHDGAMNTAADVLAVTCTSGDATDPTITITTPTSSATYESPATPLVIGGTAADNTAVTQVVCVNDLGGSTTATGTTSWTASMVLQVSAVNVITCTALDQAGNSATDIITVDYTPDLVITTGATLPTGTDDVAYSVTFFATGGTPPYSWDQSVLLSADADCAGLSFSAGGVLSGTPTAPVMSSVTCTWTARVTDNVKATATKAMTLTINAAGAEGPFDYWQDWIARGDCYRAYSLRPQPGNPTPAHSAGCASPDYTNQLMPTSSGGYTGPSPMFTYNYAGDTDPEKQDAAKYVVPPFASTAVTTLDTPVNASVTVFSLTGNVPTNASGMSWLIDDEIVNCFHPESTRWCMGGNLKNDPTNASGLCNTAAPYSCSPDYASGLMYVSRGQFGSTAASHSVGDGIRRSINGASSANQVNLPINTEDGHTYFMALDLFFASSWLHSGLTSYKMIQSRQGEDARLWESRMRWAGGSNCGDAPDFNANVHVGAVDARIYNTLGGNADWSLSTGQQLGPGPWTRIDPLCPIENTLSVPAAKWTRWYWFLDQRADDYDLMSMWVAIEGQAPVQLYDEIPISLYPAEGHTFRNWQFEFNTSTDAHVRGLVNGTPSGLRDFVAYLRHFGVLRDITKNDAEALIASPVPGN